MDNDFYQNIRERVLDWANSQDGKNNKWTEYILLIPDLFHLLCKLTLDKDVPTSQKAKLGIGIAYFVSPIDLVPEGIIGPGGYIDDVIVAAYVLNSLINETDVAIVQKHWAGDNDILNTIKHILDIADNMIGPKMFKKITDIFN